MNIKILLTLSLLVASFNAQSAVTACPSGWTKSADGLTCVLETKTTQTPNQVSNTAKPVCISGFAYSSTTAKCEKNTIASQFTANKAYAYMGGLKFGSDPQEEDYCQNLPGIQNFQPPNTYSQNTFINGIAGRNCVCNYLHVYNGKSNNEAACEYAVIGGWKFNGNYGCWGKSHAFSSYGSVSGTMQVNLIDDCDGSWFWVNENYCPPGYTKYFSLNSAEYHYHGAYGYSAIQVGYLQGGQYPRASFNAYYGGVLLDEFCYKN
jgi:hypothetical protein